MRGEAERSWSALRRPLRVPKIAPGSSCPRNPRRGYTTSLGFNFRGPLFGPGPAYPLLLDRATATIEFAWPPTNPQWAASGWSGTKTLWVVDRKYQGRVLVRGRQLDGQNALRFEDGRPAFTRESALRPSPELRIEEGSTDQPSATRVRAEGCYAFQVDGESFSYLITFKARQK